MLSKRIAAEELSGIQVDMERHFIAEQLLRSKIFQHIDIAGHVCVPFGNIGIRIWRGFNHRVSIADGRCRRRFCGMDVVDIQIGRRLDTKLGFNQRIVVDLLWIRVMMFMHLMYQEFLWKESEL